MTEPQKGAFNRNTSAAQIQSGKLPVERQIVEGLFHGGVGQANHCCRKWIRKSNSAEYCVSQVQPVDMCGKTWATSTTQGTMRSIYSRKMCFLVCFADISNPASRLICFLTICYTNTPSVAWLMQAFPKNRYNLLYH